MAAFDIELPQSDPRYLRQVEYALAFASEEVSSFRIDAASKVVSVELAPGADPDTVLRKLHSLLDRYVEQAIGSRSHTYFDRGEGALDAPDAWHELLRRRWVTPVGQGHVILRGGAARLMKVVDSVVLRDFATVFDAEEEVFPATILPSTLDRCKHFSSFPEHVDFVAHLRADAEVLADFSQACSNGAWNPGLHEGRMASPDLAVSPSCCYHCYEGMEGWEIEAPGRCVTAVLGCHRYEGSNHRTMSRLRAFTMREVIWVGTPDYVLERRARADEIVDSWADRWELDCSYEAANDLFFSDSYAVRASFQRQQEAKKELRVRLPGEKSDLSIFSSNFHATTFGRAFDISVEGRPAASGCLGWGLERVVFALFSQHGFDRDRWPEGLREDLARCGGALDGV